MVYGIGIDCVQVARMEKSLQNPRFLQRVFAPEEQQLIDGKGQGRRLQTAAANFAAKEAFMKAAGAGLGAFALQDIAALRRQSGQPYFALAGTARQFCEQNGLVAHLSLSHDGGVAVAMAVLEQRQAGQGDGK